MPGLVKIGGTSRANVQARMDELYSTGVPAPFTCAIARRVDRYVEVESSLHAVFEPSRVSPGREFFQGDPESGGCGAWTGRWRRCDTAGRRRRSRVRRRADRGGQRWSTRRDRENHQGHVLPSRSRKRRALLAFPDPTRQRPTSPNHVTRIRLIPSPPRTKTPRPNPPTHRPPFLTEPISRRGGSRTALFRPRSW